MSITFILTHPGSLRVELSLASDICTYTGHVTSGVKGPYQIDRGIIYIQDSNNNNNSTGIIQMHTITLLEGH